jgi:hypothetical protein
MVVRRVATVTCSLEGANLSQLIPCPGCNRHVRQSESSCPFCSSALSLGDVPAAELPRTRLGRAATFAFGASLALAACGGDSETGKEGGGGAPAAGSAAKGGESSGGSIMGGTHTVTPVYGAPAAGTGNDNASGSAGQATGGSGTAGPVYGAPPFAGTDNGSGGTPGVPIYGAAPAD